MQQFRPPGFQILPPVVKNLLIINGLMFLATIVIGQSYNYDLTNLLGLHYFTSPLFKPFQLVTHMFMHGSFQHIFSNMLALWMFGAVIENYWGAKRFVIFYFVCGIGGALAHLGVTAYEISHIQNAVDAYMLHPTQQGFLKLVIDNEQWCSDRFIAEAHTLYNAWMLQPDSYDMLYHSKQLAEFIPVQYASIPVVGASGAVFGVLLAFGMLFPNEYIYLYFFVPMKAKYFVILYGAFELFSGVTGTQAGVAHFAHLGGMLFGFILIKYWNKTRRRDFF